MQQDVLQSHVEVVAQVFHFTAHLDRVAGTLVLHLDLFSLRPDVLRRRVGDQVEVVAHVGVVDERQECRVEQLAVTQVAELEGETLLLHRLFQGDECGTRSVGQSRRNQYQRPCVVLNVTLPAGRQQEVDEGFEHGPQPTGNQQGQHIANQIGINQVEFLKEKVEKVNQNI